MRANYRNRRVASGMSLASRLAGATVILAALVFSTAARADSDVLWKLIHDGCVPHQHAAGSPAPCVLVAEGEGFAILKDSKGASQFLLIPTLRVTGIEDPQSLAPGSPNYFAEAWANRHFTEERLHLQLPREDISLAINSAFGRSQNQLHIHIDCVRADVAAALRAHESEIGETWSLLDVPLAGHRYRVRRVDGETLDGINPFSLVVARDNTVAQAMGRQTIVVTGARFKDGKPGFYLLNDEASVVDLDTGSGEELQDHACAVAAQN